jgi:membrane protein implicated in regulation of membrane protease activity
MIFDWIRNKSHIAQTIFILIILYAVTTVIVLCLALGFFQHLPRAHLNPYVSLTYAIISFVLTALISAFHLSTMIRRRKRKTDWLDVEHKIPREQG